MSDPSSGRTSRQAGGQRVNVGSWWRRTSSGNDTRRERGSATSSRMGQRGTRRRVERASASPDGPSAGGLPSNCSQLCTSGPSRYPADNVHYVNLNRNAGVGRAPPGRPSGTDDPAGLEKCAQSNGARPGRGGTPLRPSGRLPSGQVATSSTPLPMATRCAGHVRPVGDASLPYVAHHPLHVPLHVSVVCPTTAPSVAPGVAAPLGLPLPLQRRLLPYTAHCRTSAGLSPEDRRRRAAFRRRGVAIA